MTDEEIAAHIKKINEMSQEEMAKLWRFAPNGHIYFRNDLPFFDIFKQRFDELGGITTDISKKIGWNIAIYDDNYS